jgi:hypothetical protein
MDNNSASLTVKMEEICSSETFFLKRNTRRHHIPADSIRHCYRRENIESYVAVLYGRPIITINDVTASHIYLHGNRYT